MENRTKNTAAAMLYLSPTRCRSFDMPATLALPEGQYKACGPT